MKNVQKKKKTKVDHQKNQIFTFQLDFQSSLGKKFHENSPLDVSFFFIVRIKNKGRVTKHVKPSRNFLLLFRRTFFFFTKTQYLFM